MFGDPAETTASHPFVFNSQRASTIAAKPVACPFFMPMKKFEDGGWIHPSRLPLGAGWHGICTADSQHSVIPGEHEEREFCNMGYAVECPHLPRERASDAARFGIVNDRESSVVLSYVLESDHRPAGSGTLEYDFVAGRWSRPHSDAVLQKMASCFLESYVTHSAAKRSGRKYCAEAS
jgi:hypothetical protein